MMLHQYRAQDYERVVALLNTCFPEKNVTSTSFLWKHFDTYFEGKSLAYWMEVDDKLVSFVCFTPSLVSQGNKKNAFFSCAIQATHPQYRRQGLVAALTQTVEKLLGKNQNYYGFSNESGVQIDLHSHRIQYAVVGQMVRAYLPAFPGKALYALQPVTELASDFLNTCTSHFFQMDQSPAFINWRYTQNPKHKHLYLAVYDGENLVGYVIARDRGKRYELCHILAQPDPVIFSKILKTFAHFTFQHRKLFFTLAYLPNQFWALAVPGLYIAKKVAVYFTVKSMAVSHDSEQWLIQGGDIL